MDYYSGRPNSFSTGLPDANSDILRDLNVKCTRLEDERQLRQKSFAFLSTYMDSLAQGKVSASEKEPAQLVTFFDEFVELGKSRSETIAALDQQIIDVQKEIKEEIKRLQHEYFSLPTTVTIILAPVPGHTVGTADLELVYSELSYHYAVTFSSDCPPQELRQLGNQYTKFMSRPLMVILLHQFFSIIDVKFPSLLGRIGTM